MVNKGFQGGGLGKNGDGIRTPIKPSTTKFAQDDTKLYMYVGTSMIGGVKDDVLSKSSGARVKVHSHSGATIEDIKNHLRTSTHLQRNPSHLILQCGTNDARNPSETADSLYDKLVDLKEFAETMVPGLVVTISCPMVRSDNKWANAKLIWLKNRLRRSGHNVIVNDNITYEHLSRRGLHLNQVGTNILTSNISNFIRYGTTIFENNI
jgi:hypothetical protein